MIKLAGITIVILSVLVTASIKASEVVTSQELMERCELVSKVNNKKYNLDHLESTKANNCIGYLQGFNELLPIVRRLEDRNGAEHLINICISPRTNYIELASVVAAYAKRKPELYNKQRMVVMLLALGEQYPCN